MITYRWNGCLQRVFICDGCGAKIQDPGAVRLLREDGALPEEQPSYTHDECVEAFVRQHRGRWEAYRLSSATAAWYI